jgi:hypothetical protein
MLADPHQQAAVDNERAAHELGEPIAHPYARRGVIELYWGAAFHWLAFGCQQKHGKHKENHSGLVSYLRQLGEAAMAVPWETLERVRNAGWYGYGIDTPHGLQPGGFSG